MGFTFYIENVRVFFPFDRIYPEQYQYMVPPCPPRQSSSWCFTSSEGRSDV